MTIKHPFSMLYNLPIGIMAEVKKNDLDDVVEVVIRISGDR